MVPLRVFIGVDKRQPLGYTVCQSSIARNASVPVAITPLLIDQLPITRRGLTDFTFTRFLVPYLCGYEGVGVFLDADIIVRCDIAELFSLADEHHSVQVSRGPHRFEWPAVMLFNADRCRDLTPEYIETGEPFSFDWGTVGDIPPEYHHIVGYDAPRRDAKVVHYTAGVPEFQEVGACEHASEWHREKRLALHSCSWLELMGKSVHAQPILKRWLT